jgi:hypothetical protein
MQRKRPIVNRSLGQLRRPFAFRPVVSEQETGHERDRRESCTMVPASNRRLAVEEFMRRLRQALSSNILDTRLFGSEARGEESRFRRLHLSRVVTPGILNDPV